MIDPIDLLEITVIDMPNSAQYGGQWMTVTGREGDATVNKALELEAKDQFAAEIDHMADCHSVGRR